MKNPFAADIKNQRTHPPVYIWARAIVWGMDPAKVLRSIEGWVENT